MGARPHSIGFKVIVDQVVTFEPDKDAWRCTIRRQRFTLRPTKGWRKIDADRGVFRSSSRDRPRGWENRHVEKIVMRRNAQPMPPPAIHESGPTALSSDSHYVAWPSERTSPYTAAI